MLFWSANWMPLTISGISGTMARTVTPIKYWRSKCERTLLSHLRSCEGHVWLRGGVPCDWWRVLWLVACPDLRDVGLVQQGLDVLRDKISTSRRQCGGHDEDDQRPPPGPVDHRSMVVVRHCRHSESQSHVAASRWCCATIWLLSLLRVFSFCLFCFKTRALSFADMNVVNVGVRLQGERQADDVSDRQEGRHGVHQRPDESNRTTAEREETRVKLESLESSADVVKV